MKKLIIILFIIPQMSNAQNDMTLVADGMTYYGNKKYKEAVLLLDKAYNNGFDESFTNFLRAQSYYYLEDYKKVVSISTNELNKPNMHYSEPLTINEFYYIKSQDTYTLASNFMSTVYKEDEFLYLRAAAKYLLFDYFGAKSDIKLYITINDDFRANYLFGLIELSQENYNAALNYFNRSFGFRNSYTDDDLALIYYNMGFCYWNLGQLQEALQKFSFAGESGISEAYDHIKEINVSLNK